MKSFLFLRKPAHSYLCAGPPHMYSDGCKVSSKAADGTHHMYYMSFMDHVSELLS